MAPSPVGEGWGGGSELTTIADTDSSTDVGRAFMADMKNFGQECPTYGMAPETSPGIPPVTSPPQISRISRELFQSPTGGRRHSVGESPAVAKLPAITIDNAPTTPAFPTVLPPLPMWEPAEGRGGVCRFSRRCKQSTRANWPFMNDNKKRRVHAQRF